MSTLAPAILQSFGSVVGPENVVTAQNVVAAAERATFETHQKVLCVVRPTSTEQVQNCLKIATRSGVNVYPTSTGKNWGFGSSVPSADSVLLDLRNMNRIIDFDEELGYLTVEPGVTFAQAHAFLRARNSRRLLNSTGSSPHSSLLGNAVERGDGAGPYGDRFGHVCGLQVVTATGECVETGFAERTDSTVARVHRWGVGPALDGLFSQSRLGVVTRLTTWLAQRPKHLSVMRMELFDEPLGPLIDTVRELMHDGVAWGPFGLWNDYRVLSTVTQYPWNRVGGRTPLTRRPLEALKREFGLGAARWHGVLPLYAATEAIAAAQIEHARARLRPRVGSLSTTSIPDHDPLPEPALDPALAFALGVPHNGSLRSLYWRKRTPPPNDPDPDADLCGAIWTSPVVPLRGQDVEQALRPVEKLMLHHGFEPQLALIAQSARTIYPVPLVLYDRLTPGQDERAMACHDALLAHFNQEGFLPHRLGIQSMTQVPPRRRDGDRILRRLRDALDPADILARGRYTS